MSTQDDQTERLVDRILAGLFTDAGHAKDLASDHVAALRYFEEVVRRDPASPLAWYNLGDTLLAMERAPQACEALRQAVARAPDHALYHYGLGLALYALGQFAEAASHLEVALGPDPGLTRGQSALGVNAAITLALCREACSDVEGGVATLEPARPLAVSILYNLGRLKLEAGDDAGAEPCLVAAALVAPDDEDVRHLAGVVLMRLGRHDEAERHLAAATALEAGCVEAWYDRGCNLTRAGREGARECFEEVLRREPGHRGAREALGR